MLFGRILKIHFVGDGVIKKVFGIDSNPQTGMKRIWYVRRFRRFIDDRTKITNDAAQIGRHYVEIPGQSIIGNLTEAIKKRFTLDCYSYDSCGNVIPEEDNIVTKLTKEIIFMAQQLRNKDERIYRLEFELGQEARATRKDVVTETAGDIQKIGQATASAYPIRGGRPPRSTSQPSLSQDEFAMVDRREEEDE